MYEHPEDKLNIQEISLGDIHLAEDDSGIIEAWYCKPSTRDIGEDNSTLSRTGEHDAEPVRLRWSTYMSIVANRLAPTTLHVQLPMKNTKWEKYPFTFHVDSVMLAKRLHDCKRDPHE
jgi:hypothetical protein